MLILLMLIIIAYLALSVLIMGTLTAVSGRILGLDEVSFGSSFSYGLAFYFAYPFVGFLLFLFEYFIGGAQWITVDPIFRSIIYAVVAIGFGLIAWVALLMHTFEWGCGTTCLFTIVYLLMSMVLGVVIFVVLFLILMASIGIS